MTTLREEITSRLDDTMPKFGVPGVAVGVLHEGEETYVTSGVTSALHPIDVDDTTLFQVGSTGKTYTAAAVMRLVEQGVLDLDDPVRKYVPELQMADDSVGDVISLRHLLTHTGGHEGDLFDAFGGGDDSLSRLSASMHLLPQLAPLGTWTYSNAGFSVAGRAIETATGLSYEQAIAELLLRPLGHEHSVFGADAAILQRAAVGHRPGAAGPVVTSPWALPRSANPAGGLVSSVRDQIGWAKFNLGDGTTPSGEQLLRRETLDLMQSPLVQAGGGRAAAVGLAWLLQPTPGVIAHGGSTNGQESSFVIVPEKNFAITVLTNSTSGAMLHSALVKWALRDIAGVVPFRSETVPADAAAMDTAVGSFSSAMERLVVSRAAEGLTLRFEPTERMHETFPGAVATEEMPFELYADDRVLVRDGSMRGARGEFLRDDNGAITWLRMMGRIHVRQ